jgi:hypothetical protein
MKCKDCKHHVDTKLDRLRKRVVGKCLMWSTEERFMWTDEISKSCSCFDSKKTIPMPIKKCSPIVGDK